MTAHRDFNYDLVLTATICIGLTIAIILALATIARPVERPPVEHAAIEWGEANLRKHIGAYGDLDALCDGATCLVWGVTYGRGGESMATPPILLDCSATPCTADLRASVGKEPR